MRALRIFTAWVLVALLALQAPVHAVEFLQGPASSTAPGYVTTGTQTIAGNKTFTGLLSLTTTAAGSTAEEGLRWRASDGGANDYGSLRNNVTTDAVSVPELRFHRESNNARAGVIKASTTDDTGSNPMMSIQTVKTGDAAITTRHLLAVFNGGGEVLRIGQTNSGANGFLSWEAQAGAAPAFTTRSAGTRVVLYNAISASKVDNAIGVTGSGAANTYSVQEATSSYSHDFYGGTTKVAAVRGDGLIFAAQAGGGFGVKEGSNATMGTATLVAGEATVNTTKVTANSRIFLTSQVDGGTPGFLRVSARSAATSFTITSSSGTDTSTVAWVILEPAP